jgi:hypothetical protein
MTLNVTSPSLYALGTVTTIVSFSSSAPARRHRADQQAPRRARQVHLRSGMRARGDIELAGRLQEL